MLIYAAAAGGSFLLGAISLRRAKDEASAAFALLDRLPLACVAMDEKHRVAALNERARRLLSFGNGDCSDRFWQNFAAYWTPDSLYCERWTSVRLGGAFPDILCRSIPIQLGRHKMQLLLLQESSEILAALRKESESARDRTATELVSQIAHEVRNPVAAISGCAQLLRKLLDESIKGDERCSRLLTAEQDALCQSIVNESCRLEEIVERFVSVVELSQGGSLRPHDQIKEATNSRPVSLNC
jgi:nitrogen-specific signal transduction histidine kinase